jgi:hypothetical protein
MINIQYNLIIFGVWTLSQPLKGEFNAGSQIYKNEFEYHKGDDKKQGIRS